MGKRIEYQVGERIKGTKLSFINEVPRVNPKERRALFKCDCGAEMEASIAWVRHLNTISCGCYRKEVTALKSTKHSHAQRDNPSGAYRSWRAMHQRIKSDPHYANITICDAWYDFANFIADMGDRPDGHTIERKDGSKGYEASNCIWANRKTQAENSKNTIWVTIGGKTNSINEWCRIMGIGYHLIKQRRRRGMTLEEAITTPVDITKQRRK